MSAWAGPGPDPMLPPRAGGSPSDDRRSAYGGSSRGGYYDAYDGRDGYGRERGGPLDGPGRDWDEWDRRRADTRGRSRSPGFDDGRRKRRGSFSPSDRDRYEPRARYDEDYRGGRARSPGYRSSRFPDPYDADCPVPMRAFIDWFQATHPEDFADDERAAAEAAKNPESTGLVGVKARYEKYRKTMIAKQMELMFRYHIKSPWFNEKYNPAPPFVNLRRRVRREGWLGRIDTFVSNLKEGKFDPVSQTEPEPLSEPAVAPADAENSMQADEPTSAVEGGDTVAVPANGDDKPEQTEREDDEPTNNQNAENGDDQAPEPAAEGEANGTEDKPKLDLKDRIQQPVNRFRDDEVKVEPEGQQVLIRTIPPDIGRVKLEKICQNMPNFVYLALGDTMQKRNYYRAGWLKFDNEAQMNSVIDKLSEEKIEGFKLHVTHSTRPFSARARFAPEACTRPDRVAKDLANVRKLVGLLENEAAELRRLPETLKEPRNLPRSQGGELPDSPKPADEAAADGADGKSEEKKPELSSELDEMAVDDDPREPKDRGSLAVEERLETLFAELELREKPAHDGGDNDDAMVDDEKAKAGLEAKKNDIALELYLAYLRTAFNCCYYCSAVTDHVEELQRKCIKHIRRRPASNAEPARDDRWEESLDQKTALLIDRDNVDPREHGGKSPEEETSRAIEPHIKQEDEGKFRCKSCNKLFKATSFVEKHVTTRHSELLKGAGLEDIPFYNNFALDPHKIQPFTHVPPPNTNGQSAPPEAFGLRIAPHRGGPDGGPRARGNSYNAGGSYPPYGGPPPIGGGGGGGYYGGPPPPYQHDPYYRDYYYPPPPPMPFPPRGGGGFDNGGRRSPPRRLSDRLGGFAPYDNGPAGLPGRPGGPPGGGMGGMLEPGPGGRRRRDSTSADAIGPIGGGPPPPGAREDPRAASGRKVSYYDIDRTAEGDVELTY